MRQFTFAYGLILLLMLGGLGWAVIQWALLKALKFRNQRIALKKMGAWATQVKSEIDKSRTWTDRK